MLGYLGGHWFYGRRPKKAVVLARPALGKEGGGDGAGFVRLSTLRGQSQT